MLTLNIKSLLLLIISTLMDLSFIYVYKWIFMPLPSGNQTT